MTISTHLLGQWRVYIMNDQTKNWNTYPGFLLRSMISREPENISLWSQFSFNEYVFVKEKDGVLEEVNGELPFLPVFSWDNYDHHEPTWSHRNKCSDNCQNIQTVMDTASIEFIFTFINIWGVKRSKPHRHYFFNVEKYIFTF